MIKVKLYRVGKRYGQRNTNKSGAFYKEFKDMSELVNYLVNTRYLFFAEEPRFTKEQEQSFRNKFFAQIRRRGRGKR